jgi:hypothetical protein
MFTPYISDKNEREKFAKAFIDGNLESKTHVTSDEYNSTIWTTYKYKDGTEVKNGNKVLEVDHNPYDKNKYIKLSPEKYKELTKKINSDTQIPNFNERVGSVAASPFYKLHGTPKQDVINTLGYLTTTNSNILVSKDGTADFVQADGKIQDLARASISSKDAISDIVLLTHSPTNKGGQAVEVTFSVDLKSGKDPSPLAGMKLYFPVTPTEMSRPIFQVFNKIGAISEYETYKKKGEPYLLNTFEGSGIRATMQPLQPGSDEGQIIIEQRKWDPVTKKQSDTWEVVGGEYANLPYSLSNTTFPEIKNSIYNNFIYPYINQNIGYTDLAKSEAKAKAAQAGVATQTPVTQLFKIKK